MSPERINGGDYSYPSDVWAFALSLIECAWGKYPYAGDDGEAGNNFSFWDLLDVIVREKQPSLSNKEYSENFCDFTSAW